MKSILFDRSRQKNVLTALPVSTIKCRYIPIASTAGHCDRDIAAFMDDMGVFRHAAIERGGGGGLRMGEAQGRKPRARLQHVIQIPLGSSAAMHLLSKGTCNTYSSCPMISYSCILSKAAWMQMQICVRSSFRSQYPHIANLS